MYYRYMYRKLVEQKIKKSRNVKYNGSKKQNQIRIIKKTKINPILKLIYLSNFR